MSKIENNYRNNYRNNYKNNANNDNRKDYNYNNGKINTFHKNDHYTKSSNNDYYELKEMNKWIENLNSENHNQMKEIYNRKKVIWKKYFNKLLLKLTRDHKIEMLEYVLNELKLIPQEKNKVKYYTLLNENVWIGKNDTETGDFYEKCLKTFDILIANGYNFIDFSVLSNEITNKTEILNLLKNYGDFYEELTKENSKIPKELKDILSKQILSDKGLKTVEEFDLEMRKNDILLQNMLLIIDDYFTEQNMIEKKLNITESFIGALINDKNKISEELKNRLYEYFTNIYYDLDHFVKCLKLIFNKITLSNTLLFVDYIQFILSRNVDDMSFEIFKLLVIRESTTINEKNIVNSIFVDLVGRNDFKKYFQFIDLNAIKEKFVLNIINNYENWLHQILSNQILANPDVEKDEIIKNNYGVLLMILGICYSKGYFKNIIIELIENLILNSDIDLIKPFGIFLEQNKLLNSNFSIEEFNLLSTYINKYYINPTQLKNKFIIEDILSNFVSTSDDKKTIRGEDINLFFKTKNFINTNCSTIEYDLLKINKSNIDLKDQVGLDKQKKQEEWEEQDEQDESDELNNCKLNNKVVKNIILYMKSSNIDIGIDDLIYFIEKFEISLKEFTYCLVHSLGESSPNDIKSLNLLLDRISTIKGYNLIIDEFKIILQNTKLINSLKCDNPKLDFIISNLILQ